MRRGNNLKQHLVILDLFLELVLITKSFTAGPFSFCWQNLSIGEEKGLIFSLGILKNFPLAQNAEGCFNVWFW